MKRAFFGCAGLAAALFFGAKLPAAPTVSPIALWTDAVGSQTFLANDSNTRGMAYNPATGNLLVASRTGGTGVYVLNGQTGALVGQLNVSGISGGTFAINLIGVADDGAVYVGNLSTDTTTNAFKLYRWSSESAGLTTASNTAPTNVFSGDPSNGQAISITNDHRYGDSLDVRGSGANTQVLLGARGGSKAALLTTSNPAVSFTSTLLTTDNTNGSLGVAFQGVSNNFWSKSPSNPLRQLTIAGAAANTVNSFSPADGTTSAIGVDAANSILAMIDYGTTAPNPSVQIFDISNPASLSLIATRSFPSANANPNGVGAADFGNSVLYAMSTNNGIIAYAIPEPASLALLGIPLGLMLRRRR